MTEIEAHRSPEAGQMRMARFKREFYKSDTCQANVQLGRGAKFRLLSQEGCCAAH
jgi:hypothetical protein